MPSTYFYGQVLFLACTFATCLPIGVQGAVPPEPRLRVVTAETEVALAVLAILNERQQSGAAGPFYAVGWKMAAVVERTLGRTAVIEAACDPPSLLISYNKGVSKLPRVGEEDWPCGARIFCELSEGKLRLVRKL